MSLFDASTPINSQANDRVADSDLPDPDDFDSDAE